MTVAATMVFDLAHLGRLTDERGVLEHADGAAPRRAVGYRTDDSARALVVTAQEPDDGVARRVSRVALRFVLDAEDRHGFVRPARTPTGGWSDVTGDGESWGRAVWGLGMTATHHAEPLLRMMARRGYDKTVTRRSTEPRAMAFAALGAVAVASAHPDDGPTRALLHAAVEVIGPIPDGAWRWPEPRLEHANATLAEALVAAGDALNSMEHIDRGLVMLGWLLERELANGHLSVTPVGGAGPGDVGPGFVQRPIEVAAMADACWRAYTVTGDVAWQRGVTAAAAWFAGSNDAGLAMVDPETGAAYDGLDRAGVEIDEGAEAAISLLATMQRARTPVPST